MRKLNFAFLAVLMLAVSVLPFASATSQTFYYAVNSAVQLDGSYNPLSNFIITCDWSQIPDNETYALSFDFVDTPDNYGWHIDYYNHYAMQGWDINGGGFNIKDTYAGLNNFVEAPGGATGLTLVFDGSHVYFNEVLTDYSPSVSAMQYGDTLTRFSVSSNYINSSALVYMTFATYYTPTATATQAPLATSQPFIMPTGLTGYVTYIIIGAGFVALACVVGYGAIQHGRSK